jgi:beta-phosphoglucomutase family hydrolase
MSAMLRAVIWDMDGVIVDTGCFHYQAWKEILDRNQVPFDWDMFRLTFGMNNFDLLTHLLGHPPSPELLAELADKKEETFRQVIKGKIKPEPGILEWISFFKGNGVKQAVASSAPQANIDQVLDELGIKPFFDTVLSAEKMPGKPDPMVFLRVAQKMETSPLDCVVIEDSIAGVLAAQRAGMKVVAVTTTNLGDRLSSADFIIQDFISTKPGILNDLFLDSSQTKEVKPPL